MEINSEFQHEALDWFAHTNPAFGAVGLHWLCAGYEELTKSRKDASRHLSFVWGLAGIALLAPESVRAELPGSSAKRLMNLIAEHPHWRADLPEAMRLWAPAFWRAVAYGVSTGGLAFANGRLRKGKLLKGSSGPLADALRKRAVTLGKVFANEGSDDAIALAFGLQVTA